VSPTPLVSVVVPVVDQAVGLAATLEALAGQSLPESSFEVIVVDNGSVDDSLQVAAAWSARHPGARVVSETELRGSYAARNRGIESSSAELLAFTDADCRPDPHWLEAGLAALEESAAEVVAGRIEVLPVQPTERLGVPGRSDLARPAPLHRGARLRRHCKPVRAAPPVRGGWRLPGRPGLRR
jgi:glycosyltransferase involved in cell wall biosynthesis